MAYKFFLDNTTPFKPHEWAEMERKYSNWLKVANTCYSITDTAHLVRMLQLELSGKRRQIIIDRVYARFSALRSQQEYIKFTTETKEDWSAEDRATFKKALVSWSHAIAYINTLDYDPLPELKKLVQYELAHKRRMYLVHRLFTKFQTVRRSMEKKGIARWRFADGVREGHRDILMSAGEALARGSV